MGCRESNQTIKTLQLKKMNVYLFKVSVFFVKVNSNWGGGGGGGGGGVQVMHIYNLGNKSDNIISDLAMFRKENTPRWTSQIPKSSINTVNSLHAG